MCYFVQFCMCLSILVHLCLVSIRIPSLNSNASQCSSRGAATSLFAPLFIQIVCACDTHTILLLFVIFRPATVLLRQATFYFRKRCLATRFITQGDFGFSLSVLSDSICHAWRPLRFGGGAFCGSWRRPVGVLLVGRLLGILAHTQGELDFFCCFLRVQYTPRVHKK